MKLWHVVAIGAVVLWAGPSRASDIGGKLASASGKVWVQPPNASETPAKAGATLPPGTSIRTGDDGQAEVAFADGSHLKIRPKSSLRLSGTKRQARKNSVLLFFGRVWSKVSKTAGTQDSFEVATPNAVCGVRGTEFETAVADDGSVRVRVTAGRVGVGTNEPDAEVTAGQEIAGDEEGVEEPMDAEEQAKWEAWEAQKRERLRKGGRGIIDKVKARLLTRKEALETLRREQKVVEGKRKDAEQRARAGDRDALGELKKYNQQLADIADQIADLGDLAQSQLGLVDHFADLAGDPRFKMIDRKYLEAEAASLRRVKATLDKLVAEGTDISIEAMDKMLDDMSKGKGSLKDQNSAGDDLFGPDKGMDFDMKR